MLSHRHKETKESTTEIVAVADDSSAGSDDESIIVRQVAPSESEF